MDVYPENTISSFQTKLRKPLQFSGQWEVALVEATIPTLWKNIDHKNSRFSITLDHGKMWREHRVGPGYYATNVDFMTQLSAVMRRASMADGVKTRPRILHYSDRQRRVEIKLGTGVGLKIFQGTAAVLGFPTAKLLL